MGSPRTPAVGDNAAVKITALRDPQPGPSSYRLAWVAAADDDHPVGTAYLRVFTAGGAEHRTEAEIAVHPAERRRGAGTALLAEAVRAARDLGRRTLVAGPVESGSPGEVFLTARGLRPVLGLTYARLDLAGAGVTAAPAPGYRLVAWEGTVPDELAETFAASRRAMDDMPMDEADVGAETWDVDRVRAIAAAVSRRGDTLCTVAAIAEADGTIAGFTELVVPATATPGPHHPDPAAQRAKADPQHSAPGPQLASVGAQRAGSTAPEAGVGMPGGRDGAGAPEPGTGIPEDEADAPEAGDSAPEAEARVGAPEAGSGAPEGGVDAQHYGTGVLPEHRGRGLARWMKAEAIRHTRAAHPQVRGLLTDTADSNVAMRRVNDVLGYTPTHRSVLFQLDL